MISNSLRSLLNKFSGKGQKAQLGTLLDKTVGCVTATFDSTGQLAQATYTLETDAIPADAIITDVFHEEITDVTSGGAATITLLAGATALTGAIAKATFTGVKSEALAGSATAIKISALSDLKVTVGTADLTAGKVRFYVYYVLSKDNN